LAHTPAPAQHTSLADLPAIQINITIPAASKSKAFGYRDNEFVPWQNGLVTRGARLQPAGHGRASRQIRRRFTGYGHRSKPATFSK
jgi:hypothetical protein